MSSSPSQSDRPGPGPTDFDRWFSNLPPVTDPERGGAGAVAVAAVPRAARAAAPIPARFALPEESPGEGMTAEERELLRQLRAEFCDRCGAYVHLRVWPWRRPLRSPSFMAVGVASVVVAALATRALGVLVGLDVLAGAAAVLLVVSRGATRHRCVACNWAPDASMLAPPDQHERARWRARLGLLAAGAALFALGSAAVRFLPEPVLRYAGHSERWSVVFPRSFQTRAGSSPDVQTRYGTVKATIQTASGGLGPVALFTLLEMDLPDARVGGRLGATKVLHAALKSLDCAAGEEQAVSSGGLPGREAAVLCKVGGEAAFGRARAHWLGHSFVMAVYAGKDAEAPEGRAFLETLTRTQ